MISPLGTYFNPTLYISAEIAKSAGQTSEAGRGDTETVTHDKISKYSDFGQGWTVYR